VTSRSAVGRFVAVSLSLTVAACTSNLARPPDPTVEASVVTSAATTLVPPTSTTIAPATTRAKNPSPLHAYPIAAEVNSSYARTHGEYPATDVFADCGTRVRAMADGEVIEARTVNAYDRKTDNPALRGGPSVAILGDDNVRYYTSHLGEVFVKAGDVVRAGDAIGTIALTGDSEACHTHVGLSTTCPGPEWSVRRGVIWPWPYLDAWRKGDAAKSPAPEILAWIAKNPDGCSQAMADPHAPDASEPLTK
jgi:peptidoglycan LD-endopeptidase LytH